MFYFNYVWPQMKMNGNDHLIPPHLIKLALSALRFAKYLPHHLGSIRHSHFRDSPKTFKSKFIVEFYHWAKQWEVCKHKNKQRLVIAKFHISAVLQKHKFTSSFRYIKSWELIWKTNARFPMHVHCRGQGAFHLQWQALFNDGVFVTFKNRHKRVFQGSVIPSPKHPI